MDNMRANKQLTLALDESGAAAIVIALIFAVLCGFMGLALDIGHMVNAKSELQRTADAAALAGAMGLVPYTNPNTNPGSNTQTPNWLEAQSAAHRIIQNPANEVDNQTFTLTDGTVHYGYWSLTPPAGYAQLPLPIVSPPPANLPEPAVNVTLSRNVTLYLAPLVGVSSPQTVSATATAILPEAYQSTGVPPIAVAWDTVYNVGKNNTVQIDVVDQDFKIQSNGGIAGWFNLNGGNSVPSVRIDSQLTCSTSQVYLVPGTKATLTDYMSNGETIVVPIVQDVSQKEWAPIAGFAAFQIDPNGLGSNSITGHFVEQYFDPNVTPIAGSGTIGGVGGTPKLVSP
jgi:Flp pilus assembly protein TadG